MGTRGILCVLALFLALLAAGLWILLTGGGSRSRAAGRAESDVPGALAHVDSIPLAPLATQARQPSVSGLAHEVPRGAEAPLAPDGRAIEFVAPEDGIQVLVRVKASGEPLPGTLVTFVDFGELEAERRAVLADPEDQDQAVARFGRLFRADERGLVTVPRSEAGLYGRSAFVEATVDDLWARASLNVGAAEPVPLELAPDGDLAVRVVDSSGAPRAGIRTCYLARRLAELMVESELLPPGSLQIVCGDLGNIFDYLTCQDVVSLTGSRDTGLLLRRHPRIVEQAVRFNLESDSLNCAVLGLNAPPGSDEFDLFIKEVALKSSTVTAEAAE